MLPSAQDPAEPLVLGVDGGVQLQLSLSEEEALLDMLTKRVKERLKRQIVNPDNLLQARRDAIVAGLVPVQTVRIKHSQHELLALRRAAMRRTPA